MGIKKKSVKKERLTRRELRSVCVGIRDVVLNKEIALLATRLLNKAWRDELLSFPGTVESVPVQVAPFSSETHQAENFGLLHSDSGEPGILDVRDVGAPLQGEIVGGIIYDDKTGKEIRRWGKLATQDETLKYVETLDEDEQ